MFSDEVKYQLDFVKKSKIFNILGNHDVEVVQKRFDEADYFLKNTNEKKITLLNSQESFRWYGDIESYQSLITKYSDKEILMSASTSTPIDNFYHPLVNIFFWKNVRMRNDITWKFYDNSFLMFGKYNEHLYKPFNKNNKGILSVRRETIQRNYLFSLIDKSKFDGIIRYVRWKLPWDLTIDFVNNNKDKFPTFKQLIDEYNKSYVSFVIETELSSFMNCLTEKTILAFLTKTMPVIFNGSNYMKELKDMGFYIWNDEFGFGEFDYMDYFDKSKIIKYNQCINNFNQMSKSEIKNMYNSNLDKIENNYKIVSELLFDKKSII